MGIPPTSRHASLSLSPQAISNASIVGKTKIILEFTSDKDRRDFELQLLKKGIVLRDSSKPSSILDYPIPKEVMLLIFEQLPFRDLKSVSAVSKKWRVLSYTERLGLNQYNQLVRTVIPDVPTFIELRRNQKRRFLDMKVYGVSFINGFKKFLNIVESTEPLATPTALYQYSQVEPFDPKIVLFPSGQIEKGDLFQKSDFCIQDYYRIEKDHGDYYMENTGVIAIVKNKSLTERQIKLINEIQNGSFFLMQQKIAEKVKKTLPKELPRETRSSKKRKFSQLNKA